MATTVTTATSSNAALQANVVQRKRKQHSESTIPNGDEQGKEDIAHIIDSTQRTSKRSKGRESAQSGVPSSCFRLDGLVPLRDAQLSRIQAHVDNQTKSSGRRRSEDKGILMDLIDQTYPPLVCPVCFQVAAGRSDADQHYKSSHPGVKSFGCMHPTCNHAYSSKAGLRYHLEHAHSITLETNARVQLVSQKQTSRKDQPRTKKPELPKALQDQLDAKYNPLVCPSCQSSFPRKTNVIHHLVQRHHGEEPYKCVIAGCKRNKSYATREGLVYHLASFHDS